MATDLYSGDPKIILTEDGADMVFKGGQPVMDQGFENFALMSLFTLPGWVGNTLLEPDEQIGSEFENLAKEPITLSNLDDMSKEAVRSLKNDSFGIISANITNPNSNFRQADILIKPPGRLEKNISSVQNGQNWIQQKINPASERI